MIRLYCFPRSGNSREVKLVLAEKNLAYESINIRDEAFDKNHPDFQKASPKGNVPAIIDGDTYLSEAYDINIYLDRRYPDKPLLPKDAAKRDAINAWVKIMDKKLVLRIGLLLIETLLKPKDKQKEEIKVRLRKEIGEGLIEVNRKLDGKEYLFDDYGLADISITPHLAALGRVNMSIPDECTHLKAWFARIRNRPSFAATQQ